jgi:hypothetical protein
MFCFVHKTALAASDEEIERNNKSMSSNSIRDLQSRDLLSGRCEQLLGAGRCRTALLTCFRFSRLILGVFAPLLI